MSLYDSANGKTLFAYNIVDATHLCEDSKHLVIKYAKAVDGTLAQINNLYQKNVDLGTMVHYNISKMNPDSLANDEVFESQCAHLGCKPIDLALFIFNNK